MSNKREKFKEAALEVLIELGALAVLFGLGALILYLFGKPELALKDPELTALIGIGVVLAVLSPVIVMAYVARKRRRAKDITTDTNSNEQKEEKENDDQ